MPAFNTSSVGTCFSPGSSPRTWSSTGSCNSVTATHVLEILEVTTALFEFVARMADHRIFTNQVGISVELNGVAGRQLAWREDLDLDGWCQDHSIAIDNVYKADEVRSNRRKLAVDVARDI